MTMNVTEHPKSQDNSILDKEPILDLDLRSSLRDSFEQFFSQLGYQVLAEQPLLAGEVDKSVIFIGSSTNIFKQYLVGPNKLPDFGVILYQRKIRQQNTRDYYHDKSLKFSSYFTGGGLLVPIEKSLFAVQQIIEFLQTKMDIPAVDLVIKISSEDSDHELLWENTGIKMEFDTEKDYFYRWMFGIDGLTGRGATLAVKSLDGKMVDDFSTIVIIEKDGVPLALEWGFGT